MDAGLVNETPNLELSEFPNLLAVIGELTVSDCEFKTLVIDTLDGFEKTANHLVRLRDYNGDSSERGFEGFSRGYKGMANSLWPQLLQALDKLRTEKRVTIICLAHTIINNFPNPYGADYNRYQPAMAKWSWSLTSNWADMVLFAHRPIDTMKEKGSTKEKGKGGACRIIQTEYDAVADAKNRHNLPPEISMGNSAAEAMANFRKALADGRKTTKEAE